MTQSLFTTGILRRDFKSFSIQNPLYFVKMPRQVAAIVEMKQSRFIGYWYRLKSVLFGANLWASFASHANKKTIYTVIQSSGLNKLGFLTVANSMPNYCVMQMAIPHREDRPTLPAWVGPAWVGIWSISPAYATNHKCTVHNIHMYPYFLFDAIHHLNRRGLSLSDLVAQSAE